MTLTREEKEKKIRPVGFEFSFDTNRKNHQSLIFNISWTCENGCLKTKICGYLEYSCK